MRQCAAAVEVLTLAGVEAQIDFGLMGQITVDGKRRRLPISGISTVIHR